MNTTSDRRYKKSEQAIQAAFESLLLEIGFDAITIKELAEKANIGRKTFYLHYIDKYALLNSIVSAKLVDLAKICKETEDTELITGTISWFQYFEAHKTFFAALFAASKTVSFRCCLLDFIMKQLDDRIPGIPAANWEIVRRFTGTAILGIVESFVLDQFKMTTEEIARQVGRLLQQILYTTT